MKLNHKKRKNIVHIFLIMVVGMIFIYTKAEFDHIKLNLTGLYKVELVNCEVNKVKHLNPRPGDRGYYSAFSTNCSREIYPILSKNDYDKNKFCKGVIINKAPYTTKVLLTKGSKTHHLQLLHPDEIDNRYEFMLYVFLFFSLVLVVIIFLPNNVYERDE
ncbi:hypothetical protein [Reichenbachiella versicolor]|uniref:hypothetical protein n=1 Tax=Reichenbachiella versicolor TaxID=1821036 RepID=UPI000D6DCBC6|nr:hypothetical protein [Reichenbachiella versicolor]